MEVKQMRVYDELRELDIEENEQSLRYNQIRLIHWTTFHFEIVPGVPPVSDTPRQGRV